MTTDQDTKNELSEIVAELFEIRQRLITVAEKHTAEYGDWRRAELLMQADCLHRIFEQLENTKTNWSEPQ